MSVNNDVVAALPTTGSADKTLLRNLLYNRLAYVMTASDVPTNYVAVDPVSGAATIVIIYLGRTFNYDSTDTTTANDGVTCLVSNEGRRYKLSDGNDVFAYSVINNTTSTPPVSPALGDAYLVAAGATGAWAGKSNYIATRTIRGWEFINYAIGRLIYVEAVDTYYHRNSAGTWVAGIGAQATIANSIPLSAAINFGKRLIVENQTTTSPPGSPTVGTAYIIGTSATGAWSGKDLQLAICEVAGSFVIYNPGNGWEAYDKSTNTGFIFNGTAWISSAAAWLFFNSAFTQGMGTTTTWSGSGYNYSPSTAPQQGQLGMQDNVTISRAAHRTGAPLRFRYRARALTGPVTPATQLLIFTVALFRDSVANAVLWEVIPLPVVITGNLTIQVSFEGIFAAPDTSSHVYSIGVIGPSGVGIGSLDRRMFTIEEGS